ncbi:MAG: V-type ATP synthase subunit D [Oscillospiraceae bacterium]|jgi:V/A-type H+-transporting ATPase subunit D|nr:V-type ATP synthase subunit D [Oscillospiraceae bacterium]
MPNVIPTKGNLMAIKRSLSLARLGFDLMDRKRNILIREMMSLIDRATEIQGRIDSVFREAYASLQQANITLGNCADIAQCVTLDESLQIHHRSVMGVEIPRVSMEEKPFSNPYGFAFTNSMLDNATLQFIRVKQLICELAEVETSIYRLAFAIKKTQKRANALNNIIIPGFTADVAAITDALEEKDREEFVRLKVIKAQSR